MIEEGYEKFSKKLYLILEKQDQELVAELITHQFCVFVVTDINKRKINSAYLARVLSNWYQSRDPTKWCKLGLKNDLK